MGNAVSVDIARWIGHRLLQPFRHKYAAGAQDEPFKQAESQTTEAAEDSDDQVSRNLTLL